MAEHIGAGVDQVARDAAAAALAKMSEHEKVCGFRYESLQLTITSLAEGLRTSTSKAEKDASTANEAIKALFNRFWFLSIAVNGVLMSMCGYLLVHTLFVAKP